MEELLISGSPAVPPDTAWLGPVRVLHVMTALDVGGAEMMLLKLSTHGQFKSAVLALLNWGPIGSMLRQSHIKVAALGLTTPKGALSAPSVAIRLIRSFAPDVIQGWLYHGNLVASLIGAVTKRPVLWNIRQSVQGSEIEKRHALLTRKLLTWVQASPAKVIYNSEVARRQHEGIGFPSGKGIVIPNGFDTDKFRPDPLARREVRSEIGVPEDAILVGQCGRSHPMKAHAIFVQAAQKVVSARPNVYCIAVGRGVDRDPELQSLLSGIEPGRIQLFGERHDMHRIVAALDVASNSSISGEGFSNAVGEALCCGVPCVVTDVGDSPLVVADAGVVVPPNQPLPLADAILSLVDDMGWRHALGELARRRAVKNFGITSVCNTYDELYQGIRVASLDGTRVPRRLS